MQNHKYLIESMFKVVMLSKYYFLWYMWTLSNEQGFGVCFNILALIGKRIYGIFYFTIN